MKQKLMNMNPVVISAALTGGGADTVAGKTDYRPITPEQIAADVVACGKAGAAICHIHVRDENGKSTCEIGPVQECYDAIQAALKRENLDVVINMTSTGPGGDEMRLAMIEAIKPEMTSYDSGSFNTYGNRVFMNKTKLLQDLGDITVKYGIKPEVEIFNPNMVKNALRLAEEGHLTAPLHFQFVMGHWGGMDATAKDMAFLLDLLPEGSTWSVTGIGPASLPMIFAGLFMGADGIRVGLEDNLYMSKGVPATNVQQVERAAALVKMAGREIATAAQARELLNFPKR